MIDCEKIRADLEEILNDRERYMELLVAAEKSGDFEELIPLKKGLKRKIDELNRLVNPHDLRTRNKIAKKYNAVFVSAFKDGVAVAEIKYKNGSSDFYAVNRSGKDLLEGKIKHPIEQIKIEDGFIVTRKYKTGALTSMMVFTKKGERLLGKEFNDVSRVLRCNFFGGCFAVNQGAFDTYFVDDSGSIICKTDQSILLVPETITSGNKQIAAFDLVGKWYFIDDTGNLVLKGVLAEGVESVNEIFGKYALVRKGSTYYFLDKDGNEVLDGAFIRGMDNFDNFGDGRICGYRYEDGNSRGNPKAKCFLFDENGGNAFTGGKFEEGAEWIRPVGSGHFRIGFRGREYLVNNGGEEVLKDSHENGFERIHSKVSEGWIPVRNESLDYLVDVESGRMVELGEYDFVWPVSNGIVRVEKGGKTFYLDTEGNNILEGTEFEDGFDEGRDFDTNGRAVAYGGGQWFLIDESGKNLFGTLGLKERFVYIDGVYRMEDGDGYIYFDKNVQRIFRKTEND